MSHDPSYLPRMLAELENSDLVIGSRYVQGGAIENWPVRRRLLSAAANRYVRTITGLAVHDCTSGYRCWGRSLVDRLPLEDIESDGYSFLVEMLCLAVEHGCRVGEVPITFVERRLGRSKLSTKVLGESIVTPWRFVRGGRRWSGRRVGPSRGIRADHASDRRHKVVETPASRLGACIGPLCLAVLSLRLFHISGALPYPHHVDEAAVIGPARTMLVTGNFHPGEFNYRPCLGICLRWGWPWGSSERHPRRESPTFDRSVQCRIRTTGLQRRSRPRSSCSRCCRSSHSR